MSHAREEPKGAAMVVKLSEPEPIESLEVRFFDLVRDLAREALGRGEHPGRVRGRLVGSFLGDPELSRADSHEQWYVVDLIRSAVDAALDGA